MRCAAIVLAFVLLGTSSGLAQESASSEQAVPVYQEARHHPGAWAEHVLREVGASPVDIVEIHWP